MINIVLMDKNDCEKFSEEPNLEGQWVWADVETFKEDYKNAKYQLFRAKSGFGCDPTKMGRKVFGCFAADNEDTWLFRDDILGIATKESIEQWRALYPECAANVDSIENSK